MWQNIRKVILLYIYILCSYTCIFVLYTNLHVYTISYIYIYLLNLYVHAHMLHVHFLHNEYLSSDIFSGCSVGLRDRIPKTEFDLPTVFLGWIFKRTSMILLSWLVLGFLIYWCWCVLYLYTLREIHWTDSFTLYTYYFLTRIDAHTPTHDIRTLLKYTYISLSLCLFSMEKNISTFQWFRNQGPFGTFQNARLCAQHRFGPKESTRQICLY